MTLSISSIARLIMIRVIPHVRDRVERAEAEITSAINKIMSPKAVKS